MTKEAITEILRAHLKAEKLVLCAAGSMVPLDGIREVEALREITAVVEDAQAIDLLDRWEEITKEIPPATVSKLKTESRRAS